MTHEVLHEKVIDLALGLLDDGEARAVEAHAAGCPSCAAELASLRGTRSAMASLPPLPAPERGEAVLLAAARQAAEASGERRASWPPRWLWPAALGAASATAAVLVSLRLTGAPPASRFDEGREALLGRAPPAATAEAPAVPPTAEQATGGEDKADGYAAAAAPRAAPSAPPPSPTEVRAAKEARAVPPASPGAGARGEIGIGGVMDQERAATPATAPASVPSATAIAIPAPTAPPAPTLNAAPARKREALATARLAEPEVAATEAAGPRERAAADRSEAKSADAAPAPLLAPAPTAKPARAKAAASDCPGERSRVLRRDAAGRIVARERAGQVGGVDYQAEERFGPDGRLVGATLRLGARTLLLDEAALRAAGLEPYPGLRLAPTAAAAEAAPPACGP